PLQRPLSAKISPRIHRPRLRLPRLRQRRLDGHLSRQQRPLRFLDPARSASQRPLSQQSRRHVHRRHRKSRGPRRRLRHGRHRRRLQRRRFPRSLRHAIRPQHSLSQQRRRHVHRRHPKSWRRRSRLGLQRRLVRLRQRRPPRSLRLPLRRFHQTHPSPPQRANYPRARRHQRILLPSHFQPHAQLALSQQRRWYLHRRQPKNGHRR